jgi:hypothetical protein
MKFIPIYKIWYKINDKGIFLSDGIKGHPKAANAYEYNYYEYSRSLTNRVLMLLT